MGGMMHIIGRYFFFGDFLSLSVPLIQKRVNNGERERESLQICRQSTVSKECMD
jgi:hypothetical protein